MDLEALDWTKLRGVAALAQETLPVAVQNDETGEVIMVGYVNREALDETLSSGRAVFWSTARDERHLKGETSGDFLDVTDIRVNCEANSLLFRVRLRGIGACHTRDEQGLARSSCFFRSLAEAG